MSESKGRLEEAPPRSLPAQVAGGLQRLLYLAAQNQGVAKALVAARGERSSIASLLQVSLSASEAAVLDATSTAQLQKMIDSLPAAYRTPAGVERREMTCAGGAAPDIPPDLPAVDWPTIERNGWSSAELSPAMQATATADPANPESTTARQPARPAGRVGRWFCRWVFRR